MGHSSMGAPIAKGQVLVPDLVDLSCFQLAPQKRAVSLKGTAVLAGVRLEDLP